jgi:dTDP-4-amino-4,6-dideoxygalactose transaminase
LAFSRPALPALADVQGDVAAILSSGMVTKGSQLAAYEAELQAYTGAPSMGVSSCTSGLMLALQALRIEGAVALPSFSFCATFTAPGWNRLPLRFVDCEPDTFTIRLEHLAQVLDEGGVGAVIATYIFGNPPDLDGLEALCRKAGVPLLLDAAHAFGSLYHGQRPGGRGDVEIFSTSATKLLATGEGGVVATRRQDVARHVQVGREYGNPGNYDCVFAGMNARLSEFHSILGRWSLAHLEETATRRNALSLRLEAGLKGVPGLGFQRIREGCRSSYKDYAVLIDPAFGLSRDQVAEVLKAEGIPTRAYFDPPGHRQTAFKQPVSLPVTDSVCARVLCLPMHTHLSEADVDNMIEVLRDMHTHAAALRNLSAALA